MIENERLGINFHEFFIYDEDSPTGLRHRYDRRNVKAGSVAGSLTNTYSKVRLDYTMYATHRVIWQMHYGTIQSDMEIDHIDGNTLNNRISNLRLVSKEWNKRNRRKYSSNTSGFVGVSFNHKGAWVASWYDESGKQKQKYFYLTDHDYITAKILAIKFRETQIAILNSKGFGYTERHGL